MPALTQLKGCSTCSCSVMVQESQVRILHSESCQKVWNIGERKGFDKAKKAIGPGGGTWPDFGRGRAIEVSKTYPFLVPIFPKCIPDFIPIFKNIYPTLYQFSENGYRIQYQLWKSRKVIPFLIPNSWKSIPFLIPKSWKSIPFPMARPRTQNMYSTPPPRAIGLKTLS